MKIIKHKNIYLTFSLVLVVLSLIAVGVFRLKLSTDFTGGSVFKYSVGSSVDTQTLLVSVREVFLQNDLQVDSTRLESNVLTVQTKQTTSKKNDDITLSLKQINEGIVQQSFETIGTTVGSEMLKKSLFALVIGLIAILFYIAYAFKDIPSPYSSFRFGISAMLAMLHDVIIVFGLFAVLGYVWGIEIDVLSITAVLTVIGFSVNDTIVVFDRIRENLIKHSKTHDLNTLINNSILETLRRSIGTSFTVLVVLVSLLFFGGETIRYFILVMTTGVVVGTYSSIFVAAPILAILEARVKNTIKKKT